MSLCIIEPYCSLILFNLNHFNSRYANRAKNIKNKAKINEDPKDALLREFQKEIEKLRAQLEEGEFSVVITAYSQVIQRVFFFGYGLRLQGCCTRKRILSRS